MKILITGMGGFIASAVAEWYLENTEHEIIGLDRLDFSGTLHRINSIFNYEKYKNRISFVWHDLRASINQYTAKKLEDVNLVLHLAGFTHVDRAIVDPVTCVQDNVIGTLNLLEWARNKPSVYKDDKGPTFLYFSTDEIFGPASHTVAFKEYARYNSGNPYAASKAGAEELCVAYQNTYKLPILITHTMNVIGIRQHPEKFIPSTIRKILNGEKVIIHGNKERTVSGSRFYIHTEDVSRALHFILKHVENNNVFGHQCPKFNIVGLEESTNLQVAQKIAYILDKPLNYEIVDFHSSRPGHDLRYALDGSLLKNMGFEHQYDFSGAMQTVVRWYMQNKDWLYI